MSATSFLTGGLIDSSVPDYAGLAQQNLRNRNLGINQGMANINAIFGGGTTPMWNLASGSYDPKQNYFINKGGAFSPWHVGNSKTDPGLASHLWDISMATTGSPLMQFINPFGGSEDKPPNYKALYNAKMNTQAGDLYTLGTPKTYKGFDENFFNRAGQAYVDYATPQLAQQTRDTKDQLLYGLANRGLFESGAKNRAMSDLGLQVGQQQQQIFDTGRTTANNLKTQVEKSRQDAINQLYQVGDPSQALQSSITAAAGFQVPSSYAPLANAFGGLVNQYASGLLYNPPMGQNMANPYANYFNQQNTGGGSQAGILGPTALYGP